MKVELADEGKHGTAWLCRECDDVHLRWQNLILTLTRPQFEIFSRLAATAGEKLARLDSAPSHLDTTASGKKAWLQ